MHQYSYNIIIVSILILYFVQRKLLFIVLHEIFKVISELISARQREVFKYGETGYRRVNLMPEGTMIPSICNFAF